MHTPTKKEIESTSRLVRGGLIALTVFIALVLFANVQQLVSIVASYTPTQQDTMRLATYMGYALQQLFALCMLGVAIRTFTVILRSETPFLPVVARCIRVAGVLIIFAGFIPRWAGDITGWVLYGRFRDLVLLDETAIVALVAGGVLFAIGAIFDYGCALQKQDDETL